MSSPFVAEIRMFGGSFAPVGWATCNGQQMPMSQNTALFSLLGTYYGGDGKTNFCLPNLQGSAAMGQGSGNGLSPRFIGESAGEQNVTLIQTEMPAHTHTAQGSSTVAGQLTPVGNAWASGQKGFGSFYVQSAPATNVQMSPLGTSINGGSLPHNNMMPFLTLNFCIALQGIFPARS